MPEWAVTNTTPIITLLKIGHLDLLEKLYPNLAAPEAVWREIDQGLSKEHYVDLQKAGWINIIPVQNTASVSYLLTDLDAGEAEVIVLAQELSASLVIIDEKLGRRYAAMRNLNVTGTLGILLKAKKNGLLLNIRPILEKMQEESIWLSEAMIRLVLEKAEEL